MHLVGSVMAIPPLSIATVVLSLACRGAPQWADLSGRLLGVAVLSIVLFLVSIVFLRERGLGGMGQRLFFAAIFAWIGMVAWRMMRVRPSPRGGAAA